MKLKVVADGVLIRPVQPRLSLAARLAAYAPMPTDPMNPPRPLSSLLPDPGEVIWINHNPRPAARGKTIIPFWCFRPPHPMGLLSGPQLGPVLEIAGQIPGVVA